MSDIPENSLISIYEKKMSLGRERFAEKLMFLFEEKEAKVQGLFLLFFCSQGVGMTEPVPDWIRRAGEKTKALGFDELGVALVKHAVHEKDHHKMMIADTYALTQWWNRTFSPKLSAEIFLSNPWSPGVVRYRKMHEDYIQSETPYCQIAIEYEIEKFAAEWGASLFSYLIQGLGDEIKECLSFLKEHIEIDVVHTAYNQKALGRFLDEHNFALEPLVQAGERALDCYWHYLSDCLALAKQYARVIETNLSDAIGIRESSLS